MQGILFKPWKIKAIAEQPNIVTVTRRVIKPQPSAWQSVKGLNSSWYLVEMGENEYPYDVLYAIKPRYQIGEVVYIKEAWRTGRGLDNLPPHCSGDKSPFQYKLDMSSIRGDDVTKWSPWGKWRSPLFMPEWAARYHIKIKDVMAVRTRDISHKDCILEGIISAGGCHWSADDGVAFNTAIEAYYYLYDSINGKGKHENNWDWRYTFSLLPEGDDNSK